MIGIEPEINVEPADKEAYNSITKNIVQFIVENNLDFEIPIVDKTTRGKENQLEIE